MQLSLGGRLHPSIVISEAHCIQEGSVYDIKLACICHKYKQPSTPLSVSVTGGVVCPASTLHRVTMITVYSDTGAQHGLGGQDIQLTHRITTTFHDNYRITNDVVSLAVA